MGYEFIRSVYREKLQSEELLMTTMGGVCARVKCGFRYLKNMVCLLERLDSLPRTGEISFRVRRDCVQKPPIVVYLSVILLFICHSPLVTKKFAFRKIHTSVVRAGEVDATGCQVELNIFRGT